MTTNSTMFSGSSLLPFEAKNWIEDTFEKALFNVVWENDEPVSLIVTVRKGDDFFLSKGTNLVDIKADLEQRTNVSKDE